MTSTLIAASLVTAGLLLGTPQSPAPQPTTAPQPTPAQGVMITVVGCLTSEKVTPKETPMPGSKPGAQSAGDVAYILTDQAPPTTAAGGTPAAAKTGAATTGTTSSGATSSGATSNGAQGPARKMYVLRTQADSADLSKHVNHTVRVTGATTAPMTTSPLAGRSSEATPNAGATAPAGSTGTMFDTSNLPTLTVTTLTMVSATCK